MAIKGFLRAVLDHPANATEPELHTRADALCPEG